MSNKALRYKSPNDICYTCGYEADNRVFQQRGEMNFCSNQCLREYSGDDENDFYLGAH